MRPHFMIDIETTGIQPETNDLLQIGIVAVKFGKDGYWHPGDSVSILNHTDMVPTSEFSKAHMADLFARCNQEPRTSPDAIRTRILRFCELAAGAKPPDIRFMGWNAAIFDLPFLVEKSILFPPGYETVDGKDNRTGDFHYHVYDLAGAADLFGNILNENSSKKIQEMIDGLDGYPKIELPAGGKEHDAIYDCLSQINFLNGMLRYFKRKGEACEKLFDIIRS